MKSLYQILIFVSTFLLVACSRAKEEPVPQFSDFADANEYLLQKYPSLDGWYRLDTLPRKSIFVYPSEKEIIFIGTGDKRDTLHFDKLNTSVLKIKEEDEPGLNDLLARLFGLPVDEDVADQDVASIADSIGADIYDQHLAAIRQIRDLSMANKYLSIIYNASIGAPKHDNLLYVEDKKLKYFSETSLDKEEYTFIDTLAFIRWCSDGLDSLSSPQAFRDSLFAKKIIVTEKRNFDFVYNDFRGDKIFFGNEGIAYGQLGEKVSVKDSVLAHPDIIYVWKKEEQNNKLLSIDDALRDLSDGKVLFTFDEAKAALSAWETHGTETKDENNNSVVLLLLIIFLAAAVAVIVFLTYLLLRMRHNEKENAMDINKVNEYTDRLIAIYNSDTERNEQEISNLVEGLRRMCGREFNDEFVDAEDLKKWKESFNKKHHFVPNVISDKAAEAEPAKENKKDGDDREPLETFSKKIEDYEKKMKLYEPLYQNLAKLSCKEKVDTKGILEVIEKNFNIKASLSKEYETLTKAYNAQKPVIELFNRLVASKSEDELMQVLDAVREKHRHLPQIETVARLIGSVDSEAPASKQIKYILDRIDAVSGNTKLSSAQDSYIRRVVVYDKCKRMIQGVDTNHDLDVVLKDALDRFVDSGQSIEGAVDFIEVFRPAVESMKSKEEILRVYNAIKQVTDDFLKTIQTVSNKEKADYWDRVAIILSSISKCALPVLNILDPENKLDVQSGRILLDVKNDLLLSYVMRYFLRDSQKEDITSEQFRNIVMEGVENAISKYNADYAKGEPAILIQTSECPITERVRILEQSIKKNRDYEAAFLFIDKMWDNMVKEFLDNAKNCNDESYIIRNALNIAYHTADFLDHIKGGRGIEYCYNYFFLLNDFDPVKSHSFDFRLHDYAKSTAYSDLIYELADKYGIDHLKILIDNYFIKP